MHPYVLIPLFSAFAAAIVGTSILTRDSANRGHRLLAVIFGCTAYWALTEVIGQSLQEPRWVTWLVRISCIGWMPLGALCLHLFLELIGETSSWLRKRCLPALYGLAAVSIAICIATPWGFESVHRTAWGWGFTPGPLFFYLFAPTVAFVAVSLGVLWRRVYPPDAPISERRQGYLAFAAIAIPLLLASTTDAILPMCGIHGPQLGAASLAIVGGAIAWTTHRYGYSLLAPGTFASEILATLRDGVALVRHDGLIRSANSSLARLCGCAEDELLGRRIADFLPEYPQVANQEVEEYECQLISDPQQPIAVSLSSSFILDRLGEPVGQVLAVRDLREVVGLRSRLIMSGRLAATLRIAQPQLRHRANVECNYGRIPPLLSQAQELKQVFLNLLLNASHAIGDGGKIRVATEYLDPNIVVTIEDDGCGMPPDVVERIFDPFFSTKKVGEGMGLGLSLSYQMVKNHGGDIRVESEADKGTCFWISLPTR